MPKSLRGPGAQYRAVHKTPVALVGLGLPAGKPATYTVRDLWARKDAPALAPGADFVPPAVAPRDNGFWLLTPA